MAEELNTEFQDGGEWPEGSIEEAIVEAAVEMDVVEPVEETPEPEPKPSKSSKRKSSRKPSKPSPDDMITILPTGRKITHGLIGPASSTQYKYQAGQVLSVRVDDAELLVATGEWEYR